MCSDCGYPLTSLEHKDMAFLYTASFFSRVTEIEKRAVLNFEEVWHSLIVASISVCAFILFSFTGVLRLLFVRVITVSRLIYTRELRVTPYKQ